MGLRAVVLQSTLLTLALALLLSGLLVLSEHPRAGFGVLYGSCIGAINLSLLAARISTIGQWGVRRSKRAMQFGMGMRLLMIGLAAWIAIRFSEAMSIYGMLVGLLLTIAASNVIGARHFLRGVH